MNALHANTEQEYQNIRHQVLRDANLIIKERGASLIDFRQIDSLALAKANLWEQSLERHDDASWSWSKGFKGYAFRHPKRLDLAIWFAKSQLCGLSLGKPSNNGSKMTLDIVEGAPTNHPLKRQIVKLSIGVFENYADKIGAKQLRIMRPVNKDVISYYESYGFTAVKGSGKNFPDYLWRNL
ncbi:hypothetical protein EXA21_15300 [Vibrio cincinnatiensis]|uniref:hypothetical protein n=1 Tax=Vibrio cincinnatiensis TaxID=675 RepID=UPI001EE02892|nr:hypothetical protein [Vibrio cincinnatiensis]MCG3727562.1 hypothetical protein [Vibrio cincinnatiensis]MCG3738097.1 hypothetical protein [Vibrio cincinnatiensis]MCG3760838.1 hypothetical protein [Vibrio cincinnatiensis]MCG3764160.1 hypothetical protein [Vibrio cincinnatiensis]